MSFLQIISYFVFTPLIYLIQALWILITFPFLCLYYYFLSGFCYVCCCYRPNPQPDPSDSGVPFDFDYTYYEIPCLSKSELDKRFPAQKYSDVESIIPLANSARYTSSPSAVSPPLPMISAHPSTNSLNMDNGTDTNSSNDNENNKVKDQEPSANNTNPENDSKDNQRNSVLSNSTLITSPEKAHLRKDSNHLFYSYSTGCLTDPHNPQPNQNDDKAPSKTGDLYWLDLECGRYKPENSEQITPAVSLNGSTLARPPSIKLLRDSPTNSQDSNIKSVDTAVEHESSDENALCCAICQEDFKSKSGEQDVMVRVLPCHHIFHDECITPWICTCKATCPMCQLNLTTNSELIDQLL